MYRFSNLGTGPDLKKQLIPNFALRFLQDIITDNLGKDALGLIGAENKKTPYQFSFLGCIAAGRDYKPLYPSTSGKWQGATPALFRRWIRLVDSKKGVTIR